MHHALLIATDIGFETDERQLFQNLTVSIGKGDRIGLIGRNGEGKSTLLKILAGLIAPTSGVVERSQSVYYLPQLDLTLLGQEATLDTYLKERDVPWALFQASLHKLFGIDWLQPLQEIQTLSGGELAKVVIAIVDVKRPSVLLLDEPTNHLDIEGLEVLKKFLLDFNGAYIAVSHDPLFLDHAVTAIWELKDAAITAYGGNYSYYEEQKLIAEGARERHLEVARKGVKKIRRAREVRETKVARAERAGRRAKAEPSRDKFAEGYFKDHSQFGTGKEKIKLDRQLQEAEEKVAGLSQKRRRKTHLNLDIEGSTSKRMLLSLSDATLSVAGRELLHDINFRIVFGDRIVITGRNGSGKSSFAKSLLGSFAGVLLDGSIEKSEQFRAVYMDQKYTVIDPRLSVLENMQKAVPILRLDEVKGQLGRFLFLSDAELAKKGSVLSGGEAARLTLALATAEPIGVLVLDEPTNNLDIETLDIIAEALEDFPGALLVISHNIHFLARLGIDRAYSVRERTLKEMSNTPEAQEAFYQELVSA